MGGAPEALVDVRSDCCKICSRSRSTSAVCFSNFLKRKLISDVAFDLRVFGGEGTKLESSSES